VHYSSHQLAYFAHKLTLRAATDSMDQLAGALLDAQVDLNPIRSTRRCLPPAIRSPSGAILVDEVAAGKTIEAGLLIAQRWAERKRRTLVIAPSNLRRQWDQVSDNLDFDTGEPNEVAAAITAMGMKAGTK